MENYSIYNDITKRTDGSIYIGVVGPVRTGKSTFIKKFMETLVIPNIDNEYSRARAVDELPQSAGGKTIMTTEPKFIPNEAVALKLGGNASFKVRMIDCVGYVVENAMGHMEEEAPRMVTTPWSAEPMPFEKAAEIGTQKVITEHSTIGLLITTDGSICDIPRQDYLPAERRVVKELKEINKPFIILLNSANPMGSQAQRIKEEMEKEYEVPVLCVNCTTLNEGDIQNIMENILFEFPVNEIRVGMPGYMQPLAKDHWLKSAIYQLMMEHCDHITHIREVEKLKTALEGCDYVSQVRMKDIDLGQGMAELQLEMQPKIYYKILSEVSGVEISDDHSLIQKIQELSQVKKEYDKIACALEEVKVKGYGIVTPSVEELTLEEPKIIKQGGRYGIKLRASAPSIHLIRANIETEVSPIVGNEKQSQELMEYLMRDFETDPQKIWQSNFFGKSLHELVNEGLNNKLYRMPEDARFKIQETLQKIINEGSGGLICIIL
jgi:stage IV sporulation protein A